MAKYLPTASSQPVGFPTPQSVADFAKQQGLSQISAELDQPASNQEQIEEVRRLNAILSTTAAQNYEANKAYEDYQMLQHELTKDEIANQQARNTSFGIPSDIGAQWNSGGRYQFRPLTAMPKPTEIKPPNFMTPPTPQKEKISMSFPSGGGSGSKEKFGNLQFPLDDDAIQSTDKTIALKDWYNSYRKKNPNGKDYTALMSTFERGIASGLNNRELMASTPIKINNSKGQKAETANALNFFTVGTKYINDSAKRWIDNNVISIDQIDPNDERQREQYVFYKKYMKPQNSKDATINLFYKRKPAANGAPPIEINLATPGQKFSTPMWDGGKEEDNVNSLVTFKVVPKNDKVGGSTVLTDYEVKFDLHPEAQKFEEGVAEMVRMAVKDDPDTFAKFKSLYSLDGLPIRYDVDDKQNEVWFEKIARAITAEYIPTLNAVDIDAIKLEAIGGVDASGKRKQGAFSLNKSYGLAPRDYYRWLVQKHLPDKNVGSTMGDFYTGYSNAADLQRSLQGVNPQQSFKVTATDRVAFIRPTQ